MAHERVNGNDTNDSRSNQPTPDKSGSSSPPMLEAALKYLQGGYSVIPLHGKKPLLDEWKQYQTQRPTEQEVQGWFQQWPQAGLGLICGKVSGGLAVLDIDDPQLAQTLMERESTTGTPRVKTPSGGLHLYLRETQGQSRSGPLVPGVADLKAEGGYVVAPPTGGYTTIAKGQPLSVPNARGWAMDVLKQSGVVVETDQPQQRAYEHLKEGPIGEGVRNETLTSYAGHLWREGWSVADIANLLRAVNATRCVPPLPEEELTGIVRSVSRYPRDEQAEKTQPQDQTAEQPQEVNGFAIVQQGTYTVRLQKLELTFDITLEHGKHHTVVSVNGKKVAEDIGHLAMQSMRERLVQEAGRQDPTMSKAQLAQVLLELVDVLKQVFPTPLDSPAQRSNESRPAPLWSGLSKERLRRAIRFAKKPKLLRRIVKLIARHGIVGEQKLAAIDYLTATSAHSEDPLHVVVKGDSASGKSFITHQVLQLLPEETYFEASELTPQSLFYMKAADLDKKCLVIAEYHGQTGANYPFRLLQSEGRLMIVVTIKDPHTGQFHSEQHELQASVSSLTTTTKSVLVHDNETRVFSIYTDGSPEQTSRIIRRHFTESAGKIAHLSENTLERLRDVQRILRPVTVVIPEPLAKAICESLEPAFSQLTRSRRDVAQLLSLVKVSAFLHQYQRRRARVNGTRVVYAELQDYALAKELIEEFLLGTMYSLGPKSLQLIACVRQLPPVSVDQSKPSQERFTVSDLKKLLGWSKDEVWTWWKPILEKTNLMDLVEEGRGSKPDVFRYNTDNEATLERLRCRLPEVGEVAQRARLPEDAIKQLYRATSLHEATTPQAAESVESNQNAKIRHDTNKEMNP